MSASSTLKFFAMTLLVAVCLYAQPVMARVGSVQNPRYAALVIDSDTGTVLFARYANEKRYPASLTKMMTLYLTFEALQKGRMSLDSMLPVSRHAASMPQTNLFLRPGDNISVRDAIRALVIRSANDVAVVLGEYLAGSESNFGMKMTEKARQLGMRGTVFRNASGLPDIGQYTTARDLAVLAMALKKHFPQYYSFFRIKDFYFRGRNYHTHNRVVERLPGAEGMKTGYINMSGFNLVTTVSRNGKNLVGVVLGGRTAYTRDSHMIQLIEQAYADLRNNPSHAYAEANSPQSPIRPVAINSGPKIVRGPFGVGETHGRIVRPPVPARKPIIQLASAQNRMTPATTQRDVPPPVLLKSPVSMPISAVNSQPVHTQPLSKPASPVTKAALAVPSMPALPKFWGIQVGAYSKAQEAEQAVMRAAQMAQKEVIGGKMTVTDSGAQTGTPLHRARMTNLDEQQARKACEKLISLQQSCFVIKVE